MPRHVIEPQSRVEYLSILDADCRLDSELEPELDDETLKRLYRTMLLARRFDEFQLKLQHQGRLGTFAPSSGQEAAQLGTAAALRKEDWVVPSFRELATYLWRGARLDQILLYFDGYNEGADPGEEAHDLPTAIPVGTQIPHAVGLAYAARYQGRDDVAMVYFGDGATSEGDFHEGLNFAGVFATPTIFVCQNNQWAISVPREHQTHAKTLAQKALAYGIPGVQVDGNDVLAVYQAAHEAVERARRGEGPTLIECLTYRLTAHTTADDPRRYRSEEEEAAWKRCDPLRRFRHYLEEKGLLGEEAVAEMEQAINEEVKQAWKTAEERMAELTDPTVIFDHQFAEMPAYLQEQRDAFIARHRGEEERRDG
jgi:pyruvate dehydrogenase E1 component alpha subunit